MLISSPSFGAAERNFDSAEKRDSGDVCDVLLQRLHVVIHAGCYKSADLRHVTPVLQDCGYTTGSNFLPRFLRIM